MSGIEAGRYRSSVLAAVDRINRQLMERLSPGLKLEHDVMRGQGWRVGITRRVGVLSRYLSPRLSTREMFQWLSGFEEALWLVELHKESDDEGNDPGK